jgi:hypothetical protein
MTQRFEMLERAASTAAPALTPERSDTPFAEYSSPPPVGERPTWGARQGGPRPTVPLSLTPEPVEPAIDEPALTRHWAKLMLDTYSARNGFFPDGLFADPAWDMLLDLMHAQLNGKQISVSSLCIAARVPATTALRRIGDLVGSGLARRVKDVNDGRRVFVELTADGTARMERYMALVRNAVQKPVNAPRKPG